MKLDAYEYVSVAIPGAVMLFICMLLFPELREILGKDGIQLGGLGLILVLSLAVGQLGRVDNYFSQIQMPAMCRNDRKDEANLS